jgi:hypothetical protein
MPSPNITDLVTASAAVSDQSKGVAFLLPSSVVNSETPSSTTLSLSADDERQGRADVRLTETKPNVIAKASVSEKSASPLGTDFPALSHPSGRKSVKYRTIGSSSVATAARIRSGTGSGSKSARLDSSVTQDEEELEQVEDAEPKGAPTQAVLQSHEHFVGRQSVATTRPIAFLQLRSDSISNFVVPMARPSRPVAFLPLPPQPIVAAERAKTRPFLPSFDASAERVPALDGPTAFLRQPVEYEAGSQQFDIDGSDNVSQSASNAVTFDSNAGSSRQSVNLDIRPISPSSVSFLRHPNAAVSAAAAAVADNGGARSRSGRPFLRHSVDQNKLTMSGTLKPDELNERMEATDEDAVPRVSLPVTNSHSDYVTLSAGQTTPNENFKTSAVLHFHRGRAAHGNYPASSRNDNRSDPETTSPQPESFLRLQITAVDDELEFKPKSDPIPPPAGVAGNFRSHVTSSAAATGSAPASSAADATPSSKPTLLMRYVFDNSKTAASRFRSIPASEFSNSVNQPSVLDTGSAESLSLAPPSGQASSVNSSLIETVPGGSTWSMSTMDVRASMSVPRPHLEPTVEPTLRGAPPGGDSSSDAANRQAGDQPSAPAPGPTDDTASLPVDRHAKY